MDNVLQEVIHIILNRRHKLVMNLGTCNRLKSIKELEKIN